LSRNPLAPELQRGVHILVEVEHGDDDDRDRIGHLRAGEPTGDLQPVHSRHPHVQQAHVRT
jgi:hypothetical protein